MISGPPINISRWQRTLLALEPALLLAVVGSYLWWGLPTGGTVGLRDVLTYAFLALYPPLSQRVRRDSKASVGLRFDNFVAAVHQLAPIVVVMLVGIVVIGRIAGVATGSGASLVERTLRYSLWGPVQQYWLCGFVLLRLRQAGFPRLAAIVVSAGAFALLHLPNPCLVTTTFVAGCVLCWHFLLRPNIFAAGLAHAILAVTLYHAWPVSWHERLAVGRPYVLRRSYATHLESATRMQTAGRLAEAAREYQAALLFRPGKTDVLMQLGSVLVQSGRRGEAVGLYREALQADPANARIARALRMELDESTDP